MSLSSVSCPHCGQPVDPQDRNCPHCEVDLAMAAVLVERALASSTPIPSGAPIVPEILVPRLGEYLLEKGVLNQDDLERALVFQKSRIANGKPCLLGQSLLELGLVEREVLDQVITEQILQLQAALHQSNRQLEQRVRERTYDLQDALNKLSELNQLKSNFISNISHELRTPLTHIRGYLDLLADGSLGPLSQPQVDALAVLLRSEARLEQLIDDLIRFSLAAKGDFSLQFEQMRVNELISRLAVKAQRQADAKGVALQVVEHAGEAWVLVDEEKMTWVLMQLLDNAIKFTDSGGQVILETSSDRNLVKVSVRDTGIGIPSERIDEIFEPFHQLDSSETRRYGGTGLGLALVRRIVDAHGSTIKVQSKVGIGSSFEFYLPIANINHHEERKRK